MSEGAPALGAQNSPTTNSCVRPYPVGTTVLPDMSKRISPTLNFFRFYPPRVETPKSTRTKVNKIMSDLKELIVDQLQDLLNAENQIAGALPKMVLLAPP